MNSIERITYYDVGGIVYPSFYLTGLQENEARYGYTFDVARRLAPELQACWTDEEWRALIDSVLLFRLESRDDTYYIAIDMRDSACRESGHGYHLPVLDKVRYYFKANYDPAMVVTDPLVRPFAGKIVEATHPFPTRMPRPRSFQHLLTSPRRALARAKYLATLRTVGHFRQLRRERPTHDAFVEMIHYGPSHHNAVMDTRFELVKALRKESRFEAVAGLFNAKKLPPPFAEYQVTRSSRDVYLRNLARSRILIYLRGPHDAISFKFGEMMALGRPIIGQKLLHNRDTLYSHPYFDEQFAYEDPEEIVVRPQNCWRILPRWPLLPAPIRRSLRPP